MFTLRTSHLLLSLLIVTFIFEGIPNIAAQEAQPEGIPDAPSRANQQPDKAQSKEEAEALLLLKESRSLLAQGKLNEAITMGERALSVCESAVASNPLCSAAAKLELGKLYTQKGDLARAEQMFLPALEIFEKHLGPDKFDGVGWLLDISESFWKMGDRARGLQIYERAVAAQERKLGPEHPDVVTLLGSLGAAYREQGNYAQAEQKYKRALSITEKLYGSEHQEVGWVLNRLGGLYRVMGADDLSVKHYKRALEIFQKILGNENTTVATILDNLGLVYQEQYKLELAEQIHKQALAIFEKILGPDHLDVAIAASNLAGLFIKTGDYDQSEQLYRRSLEIKGKKFGVDHPEYATELDNFANLYQLKLDYKGAEQMRKRALEIYTKTLGAGHLDVAIALANLAHLYLDKGDYVQAERTYERSLSIRVNAIGENHPDVARTLIKMAEVYNLKGDHVSAMGIYRRVFAIAKAIEKVNDPFVASALNGVANIYKRIGDLDLAEQMYKRALEIDRKFYGYDTPLLLDALASIYLERGDLDQAERLVQQVLSLRLKRNGEYHPAVASSIHNLAAIYHLRGDYSRAEQMYNRARAIYEKALGSDDQKIAQLNFPLGLIEWSRGNITQAIRLLGNANDFEERQLARILPTGSENQKRLFMINISPLTYATLSFNAIAAPLDPGATRLAFTTALRRKGRVLDAMTDEIGALRRRLHPQDRALFDQLSVARARYAALALKPAEADPVGRRVALLKLREQMELLEMKFGRLSSEISTEAQDVTIERVQRAIPVGAALVEIVTFTTYNAKTKSTKDLYGVNRYAAYVLQREGVPAFVDLGEREPIDRVVSRLRAFLRDPKSRDAGRTARALDELVMRPIRARLGDARMILLSPDGALNLVPLGVLVDEQGRYLIENYSISYLTSGRDLLRLQVERESREPPKVFADPLYDLSVIAQQRPTTSTQAKSSATSSANNPRSKDFSTQTYRSLPGTAAEAAALSKLFPGTTLLTQAQATEAALKKVNRPRLLHIATHGFFLADRPQFAAQTRGFDFDLGRNYGFVATANNENPLLRSGLILAGVKQQASGPNEDGVLTALEVSDLDLWGTKLVVLSACETGLGDVENGQGVYGLRRALVLAGSETQVMSLWKVSDVGTRDLMIAYYTRLQLGESRTEALRQVQLAMLQGKLMPSPKTTSDKQKGKRETSEMDNDAPAKDYRHPYYWAAFIPSGDWRILIGKYR